MANGIYKFQNKINNMIYIGQAADLETRKQKHFKNAMYDMSHQEKFYQGIREYGWDNFSYEILEQFDNTNYDRNRLDKLEDYYILLYNSLFPNGYNMVRGGTHGASLSKRIKVKQYDLQGTFIQEFESAAEAGRILNINNSSIIACCKGNRQRAGEYQWRYSNDNLDAVEDITKNIVYSKGIYQYDLQGNLICFYNSIKEASKITNIDSPSISIGCKTHKVRQGFQWRYEDDNTPVEVIKTKYICQYDKDNNFIKKFQTNKEASQSTGINLGNINSCCNGKRKTAGGFIWRYEYE